MSDQQSPDHQPQPAKSPIELTSEPAYGRPATQPASIHILDYLGILYKRRWTMIVVSLIVLLSTVIYNFTATPIYRATARVLIENENPNVVSFEQVLQLDRLRASQDYYQTQYRILESRSLAERTVKKLGAARFVEEPRNVPASKSALRRLLDRWLGDPPIAYSRAPEVDLETTAVNRFLAQLTITPVRNSRLVDISYDSPDPVLATAAANAQAAAYIDQNLEYRISSSQLAANWLSDRLDEQRKKVEESSAALQQYKESNDSVSLEDRQNIIVQKLADLNAVVTRVKTERIQKEAAYRQLRAIRDDPAALDSFPAILSNGFIQQLRSELTNLQRQYAILSEKLGDHHPEIVKLRTAMQIDENKLQGEIGKTVQSITSEYQAVRAQEESLTAALEAQKREALELNRKAIPYGVLQRAAASNEEMFKSLLQRSKETTLTTELKVGNIRVTDPAERPQSPTSPQRRRNTGVGALLGVLLGIAVTFAFEYLDDTIKTPHQLQREIDVPNLGMVPLVRLPNGGRQAPLISGLNGNGPASFHEAVRTVRTNLVFSSADDGCRVVVVTSTTPGEGKTVTAANLAISLAQLGRRVLLIDADLRRSNLHKLFDINRDPGLANLLVGTATVGQVVQKSKVPGLQVMPAGYHAPNPSELLGSTRFNDLLKDLREHFDWILIDSPPVLVVSDAAILGHVASGVLFVVAVECALRRSILTALDQIRAAQGHVLGAVLNRVDLARHPYFYNQYYRREYGSYYVTEADTAKKEAAGV